MAKQTLSILIVAFVIAATSFLYVTSTLSSTSHLFKSGASTSSISASIKSGLTAFNDCPFFECPTSDSYPESCLDSVLPPWPICKFKTVDDWVACSQDSATRCCGDDLSECKCPKKDTEAFLDKIGDWCAGVATCE